MTGLAPDDIRLYSIVAPDPARPVPEQLTVLSANLLNPFARLTRAGNGALLGRLEAFARLVEAQQADLLLCQEAGRGRGIRVDNWLAARLNMNWVYVRANGRAERFGREEGLAIFSRYPLSHPVACLLSDGLWRRPALGITVETPLGEVAAYTTHLSLRPWRNRRQPARLRDWVEATAGERAAITGGDFNTGEAAPGMVMLGSRWIDAYRALNPAADGATHELKGLGRLGRQRLDYLFLRPGFPNIRVVGSKHLNSSGVAFSDHLAVLARFELVA